MCSWLLRWRTGVILEPVAFIDDDQLLHRRKANGLRIYPLSSLSYLIERHQVSDVLLAMPSAKRARISELIRLLEPYAVHVMSMPGLSDIAQGRVTVDALQEVDIDDLLGRNPVAPDQSLLHATISWQSGYGDWGRRFYRIGVVPANNQVAAAFADSF